MQELCYALPDIKRRCFHKYITREAPPQTCADQSQMFPSWRDETDQRLFFKIEALLTAMSMTGGWFATALNYLSERFQLLFRRYNGKTPV